MQMEEINYDEAAKIPVEAPEAWKAFGEVELDIKEIAEDRLLFTVQITNNANFQHLYILPFERSPQLITQFLRVYDTSGDRIEPYSVLPGSHRFVPGHVFRPGETKVFPFEVEIRLPYLLFPYGSFKPTQWPVLFQFVVKSAESNIVELTLPNVSDIGPQRAT